MPGAVVKSDRSSEGGAGNLPFPPGGASAGWEVVDGRALRGPAPAEPQDLPAEGSMPVPPGRTVIVVNDAQRPTPSQWLLRRLAVDWKRDDLTVAVATGSHPPPTEKALAGIFGEALEKVRPHLFLHGAGGGDLVDLGRTARGTPVQVSPRLQGAGAVICLGSVEPHYFAGWTGGRKSLLPGLCSMETMRANHLLALEETGPGELEGNALHEDLDDGARLICRWLESGGAREISALNVVTSRGKIHGHFHGPLLDAVEALAPLARKVFGCPLDGTFPAVVCLVEPPLDRDLYQALKAFENWKGAVAPGGVIIVAAECAEGMGPPSFRQFMEAPPSLAELTDRVRSDYRLGDHKLARFLRFVEGGRKVGLLSSRFPPGPFPLKVFVDAGEALAFAGEGTGEGKRRLLVVEDAAHTFPLAPGSSAP